jgi:hypothetical protein
MKKDHYVIAKQRTTESYVLFLGRVTAVNGSILEGYKEHFAHLPKHRKLFEVPTKDVAVDLGPSPYPGTVFKFDTSHLYSGRKIVHEFFGDIYFFYKPQKEVGQTLMKAFDKAAEILQRYRCPAPENTVWEVNPKEMKGKWAGFFKSSKYLDKMPDRFSIKPESVPITLMTLVYVIIHEYGHWFHHHLMKSPKVNATWIKVFNTSIKPQTIDKETSKRLLDSLLAGEERPSDFKGQLEEDDRNAFNWILRTISQDHAVGIRELSILFDANQLDEISSLWPKRTLNKKDLQPVVSEYACKSYSELWAESMAF